METTANSTIHRKLVEKSKDEVSNGRICLASNKTLNKVRFEMRSQNDLDNDDLKDVQLKAESGKLTNIAEIKSFIYRPKEEQCRFSVTLISDQQLNVLRDELKKCANLRLLLDGTGKITRNVRKEAPNSLHHVLLLPITKKGREKESFLYPVAEIITNDSTSISLQNFLRLTLQRLQNIDSSATSIAAEIGTDFCWANINAIIKMNNISVKEYIKECFNVYAGDTVSEKFKSYTIPVSCFGHLSKNLKRDIDRCFDTSKYRNFVASLIGGIILIENPIALNSYIQNLLILLATKHKDKNFNDAIKKLKLHFQDCQRTALSEEEVDLTNEDSLRDENALYKDSPFYQHFFKFVASIKQSPEGTPNEVHSPAFLKLFLKKYLAFLPFWSIFLISARSSSQASRNNNARIERYFRMIKDRVEEKSLELGQLGHVKLGRYVEFNQDLIDSLSVEISLNLGPHLCQKHPKAKKTDNLNNVDSKWKKNGRGHSKVFLNEKYREPLFE